MDLAAFILLLPIGIDKNRTTTILGPTCLLPHLPTDIDAKPTTDTLITFISSSPDQVSTLISSIPEWKSGVTKSKAVDSLRKSLTLCQVTSESKLDRVKIQEAMTTLKTMGNAFNTTYKKESREKTPKSKPAVVGGGVVISESPPQLETTTEENKKDTFNHRVFLEKELKMYRDRNAYLELGISSRDELISHQTALLREHIPFLESLVLNIRDDEIRRHFVALKMTSGV